MVNRRILLFLALGAVAILTGCVSIRNDDGINPPAALCSRVRGTMGVPKAPVSVAGSKKGESGTSVHVKEWIYSGISANVTDMALKSAVENGGLTRVDYVDYEMTSYLGFVTVFNLVAYGE